MNTSGQIIRLSEIDSTNNYTSELVRQSVIPDETTVVTDFQIQGRGQRDKMWQSDRGMNLLSSTYKKFQMPVSDQFHISASVAVAVCRLLSDNGLDAHIKWPNDIMIGGKKIAGLLVENQVSQSFIDHSIIGIGLNVNQSAFDDFPWPATSMLMETGQATDLNELLIDLRRHLFMALATNGLDIRDAYSRLMFGKGEIAEIESLGQLMVGRIKGVTNQGLLMVQLKSENEGQEMALANASIKKLQIGW